jgi:hypothetical protein
MELTGITEEDALEIILRSAADYVTGAARDSPRSTRRATIRILVHADEVHRRGRRPPPQTGSFQQPAITRRGSAAVPGAGQIFRRSSRADSFRRRSPPGPFPPQSAG